MSKKKKRRLRLGDPSSQSELIVRNLAQEPRVHLRLNAAGIGEFGLEKMSDVLLRFAEPILDQVAPLDEKKATLLFAITAWNYCLMSSEERSHMRLSLSHIFNNARYRADFEMLIQRKTELYPRNRRLFMGLEVAESAGRLQVNVVSTDLDRIG
jgi:tetrahydromethanopterin S-methyltransferase subunit F